MMKKKTFRKRQQTYASYIHKLLKQVHPDLCVSSRAILQINGIVEDLIARLTDNGAVVARVGKKTTLAARHVQSAAKILLPCQLSKHAVSEGTKAVAKYCA